MRCSVLGHALLAAALLCSHAAPAGARAEKTVKWTAERVFPAAVRFLRVDEQLTILEKDAEAGYVIFELAEEGKTFRGALEMVTKDDDDQQVLRLILRIDDRPEYMESGMLERLERKLRDDLGPPPPPKPKPKPEPEPSEPTPAP